MRPRWLLPAGACLLSVGLALAQPPQPHTSPGATRTAVPAGLEAPTNRIPERAGVRGFAADGETRTALSVAEVRGLTQPDAGDRAYHTGGQAETTRAFAESGRVGDASLFRVQDGDKVNKLSEAAGASRHFGGTAGERAALPQIPTVPDRRVIGDR